MLLAGGLALWGNRADLSHKAGDLAGQSVSDDDLLVDDRRVLVEYLQAAPAEPDRPVHLVLDNAGLELASDLALVDALLAMGNRVVIHAKPYPMFVSDATISDVWRTLDALDRGEDRERALVQRLRQAWADGRLRLVAPLVWASGRFLWDMPPAFREALTARAVPVKATGYRQLTGDDLGWRRLVRRGGELLPRAAGRAAHAQERRAGRRGSRSGPHAGRAGRRLARVRPVWRDPGGRIPRAVSVTRRLARRMVRADLFRAKPARQSSACRLRSM